jgi:hypothetical protein
MIQNKTTKTVILTYISYLALFIGTGFISGAIVHTGNISELEKYIIIGLVGISLFVAGSFMQESIINANNPNGQNVIKFFIFSLMLSIGIGMISGGTQHFSDFPIYSSYLIPIGFILSYVAFLLKNNFTFTKKLLITGGILTLIAVFGFFGLNTFAKNLIEQKDKDKVSLCTKTSYNPFVISTQATAGHNDESVTCNTQSKNNLESKNNCPSEQSRKEMPSMCILDSKVNANMSHDMSKMVKDDKTFLENMIPHHIEAINTSKIITQSTGDSEIK